MYRTSLTVANEGNWANLLTGESHATWGAFAVAGLGAFVVIAGWSVHSAELLAVGILLLVLGIGIAVDLWAHQFQH